MRRSPLQRLSVCCLALFLAALAGPALAASAAPPAQTPVPERRDKDVTTLDQLVARLEPQLAQAADECSAPRTPCCCRVGGSGTCTTEDDCVNTLGGKCVTSAPGCN